MAGKQENLLVGYNQADQTNRDYWRVISPEIPNQESGKDEASCREDAPQQVRSPPWQYRKGSQEDKGGGQVDKQRYSLVCRGGLRRMLPALGTVNSVQLTHVVGVVMFKQASGAVINCLEIHQQIRSFPNRETQPDGNSAGQQDPRQCVAPSFCHGRPLSASRRT